MLEPLHPKKSKRSVVVDFVIFVVIVVAILTLVQLCEWENTVRPGERDCLSELRSSTRKDTNFTTDEVIQYGRCVEAHGGD